MYCKLASGDHIVTMAGVMTELSNNEGTTDGLLLISNTDFQYEYYSNINNEILQRKHHVMMELETILGFDPLCGDENLRDRIISELWIRKPDVIMLPNGVL